MNCHWIKQLDVRVLFASSFLLLGLGLAVVTLFGGMPVVALALALSGIYAGLGILLGVSDSLENPIFQISAAIIGAIGILGVFLYSNFFKTDLQISYIDVLTRGAVMESSCNPMKSELINIQKFAIAACASQGNSDQMGAVVELGKGLHFGPTLTLADSTIALSNAKIPNYCAKAFKAANQLCPAAFASMSDTSRKALFKVVD